MNKVNILYKKKKSSAGNLSTLDQIKLCFLLIKLKANNIL